MNERKTVYVPVLMEAAEHAALRSVADERSCSVGAVVRWAVREALAKEIAKAQEVPQKPQP